ncbi:MAG: Ig-like domain-containing protein [Atribacterota bacterium]
MKCKKIYWLILIFFVSINCVLGNNVFIKEMKGEKYEILNFSDSNYIKFTVSQSSKSVFGGYSSVNPTHMRKFKCELVRNNLIFYLDNFSFPQIIDIKTKEKATGEEEHSNGVSPNTEIEIKFNEYLQNVENGIKIYKIINNKNENVYEHIPSTINYNSAQRILKISKSGGFPCNSVYEIRISSGVRDILGNEISPGRIKVFRTMFDYNNENIIPRLDDRKVFMKLSPGSVIKSGYGVINEDENIEKDVMETIENATNKFGNDNFKNLIDNTVYNFVLYDEDQNIYSENFNNDVEISISYKDEDNNGLVDNYVATREDSLSIYWLNEEDSLWVKVPSKVYKDENRVEATVPHFSVYGVVSSAEYDLSDAYAYPVPWVPNDGNDETGNLSDGITFANLSSKCEIKIYTVTGELVNEINHTNGSYIEVWDGKTKDRKKAASGMYIYRIHNSKENKSGKLMIIR